MPRTTSTKKASSKTTTTKAATKDNQRGARLPEDILVPFDTLCQELGFEDAELMRRLLRLAIRPVLKDRTLLISKEASQPIE